MDTEYDSAIGAALESVRSPDNTITSSSEGGATKMVDHHHHNSQNHPLGGIDFNHGFHGHPTHSGGHHGIHQHHMDTSNTGGPQLHGGSGDLSVAVSSVPSFATPSGGLGMMSGGGSTHASKVPSSPLELPTSTSIDEHLRRNVDDKGNK